MAKVGVYNLVGLFIEKGTSPHTIAAKNALALMLPVNPEASSTGSSYGRDYGKSGHYRQTGKIRQGRGGTGAQIAFFKSVHHPGQQPAPFLYPAFVSAAPLREALLMVAGKEITAFLAAQAPDEA